MNNPSKVYNHYDESDKVFIVLLSFDFIHKA